MNNKRRFLSSVPSVNPASRGKIGSKEKSDKSDKSPSRCGEIKVNRVFAAVDCGIAIDPPNVRAQVRSAINYGLSASLYGKVDIDDRKVLPKNFDTYSVVTLKDAPEIIVEIANSGFPIGGVGEIGTPGIAPALGNAIFAASGKRLRSLPFWLDEVPRKACSADSGDNQSVDKRLGTALICPLSDRNECASFKNVNAGQTM
jgi:hypothetical protein